VAKPPTPFRILTPIVVTGRTGLGALRQQAITVLGVGGVVAGPSGNHLTGSKLDGFGSVALLLFLVSVFTAVGGRAMEEVRVG